MNIAPLSRKENIVVQQVTGEVLIYDLKTNKAFCLNETSALVWESCDGKTRVPEIASKISKKLKKPVSEDLIRLALGQLNRDHLLENADGLGNQFAGLSRREVIRRVGFASAIALPSISSLVAPEAVTAQSGSACFALLASCANAGECCSGACNSVRGNLTCCAGSSNTSAPGADFSATVRCPVGPPCDTSPCNGGGTGAGAICCSGVADPIPINCAPFGDGTMQACECVCA